MYRVGWVVTFLLVILLVMIVFSLVFLPMDRFLLCAYASISKVHTDDSEE